MKKLVHTLTAKTASSVPPVWFMRQAGRYLPEYRDLRSEAGSFLDLVYNPDFATEVTLQPIRRYRMDGAILFSDILIVPHALGLDLKFAAGEGPILDTVRSPEDFEKLSLGKMEERFGKIYETVSQVSATLSEEGFHETSLIGFAGSPFTVACYMVQGHGKCDFPAALEFMRKDPEGFAGLIAILIETSLVYLKGQIEAGAEALQLFESWADLLTDEEFEDWVITPNAAIISHLKEFAPHIPVIGFPRTHREGDLLSFSKIQGLDGMGLTHSVNPRILEKLPATLVTQGWLAPETLLAGGDTLEKEIAAILDATKSRPHIFNLGHGVIKETDPANVEHAIQLIRGADQE
ncbi:MAG: uroporphyrinogen decarboxylase [Pseudobdellovibrionaceae bacterium]